MTVNTIYTGNVRHRRYHQKHHQFNYNVMMFCFNIGQTSTSIFPSGAISVEKFNWFSFKRHHYFDRQSTPLDSAIRKFILEKSGTMPQGKILLLTNLACLGYCFNPISFYFVFDSENKKIESLILEVTNTPWGERKIYFQDLKNCEIKNNVYYYQFAKELHVSPFFMMDYQYKVHFKIDNQKIVFHLESFKNGERHFDATLSLKNQLSDQRKIKWILLKYPFITYKVTLAIYWQAFKLWVKGVSFYGNPRHSKG